MKDAALVKNLILPVACMSTWFRATVSSVHTHPTMSWKQWCLHGCVVVQWFEQPQPLTPLLFFVVVCFSQKLLGWGGGDNWFLYLCMCGQETQHKTRIKRCICKTQLVAGLWWRCIAAGTKWRCVASGTKWRCVASGTKWRCVAAGTKWRCVAAGTK